MSEATNADRKVDGLLPRKSNVQTDSAPLGRMLLKNRDHATGPAPAPEEEMVQVTVSIPKSLRARARAAYKATSYAEQDRSWSHMVSKALATETAKREETHNGGGAYDGGEQKLAPGRKLKDE